MASSPIAEQILREVEQLPLDLQQRVLHFIQALALARPRGTPGKELLRFSGVISREDADLMKQAIEEECERIDPDGW
jgi:hypothetical protein